MYQTGYAEVSALSTRLPLDGGICRWYYTPRENIAAWPIVDPATQYLVTEPTLKVGAQWYGPVRVPNDQLGFEEPLNRGKAGMVYKQKISGFHPGDDGASRINQENMPYYEYVVVAKLRAGGLWLVFGNAGAGMQYDTTYASGALKDAAGTKFTFTMDSLVKAQILAQTILIQ